MPDEGWRNSVDDTASELLYKMEKQESDQFEPSMALTQRLQLRQSQALVMTPQLMQAIKLLQLSNLDLVAYVEAELERNPLLDHSVESEAAPGEPNGAQAPDQTPANGEAWNGEFEGSRAARRRAGRKRPSTTPRDDDSEPVRARSNSDLPAGYSDWAGVGSGGRDDGDYNLESFVSAETTLADWLREQLTLAIADPARRMIGQYLIDLVDEAGYLSGDLAAAAEKLGTSTSEIESRARHPAEVRSARRMSRAISPNAWRSSSRSKTASIPPCRR